MFLVLSTQLALASPHGVGPDWSTPIDLPTQTDTPGAAVGHNIAAGASGAVYALANEKVEELGQSITLMRSWDGGTTWEAPMVFPPADGGFIGTIAVDYRDRLHVNWIERVPTERLLHAWSDDQGDTWSEPVTIVSQPEFRIQSPSVSPDRLGRVHLGWHEGNMDADEVAETWYARSPDGGQTWEEPILLSDDDGLHSAFPRFNFGSVEGDLLAIPWRDQVTSDDWDIVMAVSEDGGQTWNADVAFGGAGAQWDPDILVDSHGVIHMGIMEYPNGVSSSDRFVDVLYARSADGGLSWSQTIDLVEPRSRFPHLLHDNSNDVLWFFTKDERDYASPQATYADIVGAYSLDGGLTWSETEFATDEGDEEVGLHGFAIGPDGTVHLNYLLMSDERAMRYVRRDSPVEPTPADPDEVDDEGTDVDDTGTSAAVSECGCASGTRSSGLLGWMALLAGWGARRR
jgi:hypothetical protein